LEFQFWEGVITGRPEARGGTQSLWIKIVDYPDWRNDFRDGYDNLGSLPLLPVQE